MKITELRGRPQVFTLKTGKTLRIFARKTVDVAEIHISNEMRIAEKMGLILMTPATRVGINREAHKNKNQEVRK